MEILFPEELNAVSEIINCSLVAAAAAAALVQPQPGELTVAAHARQVGFPARMYGIGGLQARGRTDVTRRREVISRA